MKTPILFIIFNRPDTTQRVFDAIKKYKPTELYIAADGPRESKPGEKERCKEARKITEKIDWPCKVKRLYRNKNLGCKYAVSGAITWFFENVEEGIILEDDCLPDQTFFTFCEQTLSLYRHDKRIVSISGDNFQNNIHRGDKGASYYFSKYPHIWGWASWRRVWRDYSLTIDFKDKAFKEVFNNLSFLEKIYWFSQFWSVNHNLVDTWDYQWLYMCWKNGGLSILPNSNLIINIGFGPEATNTKSISKYVKNSKLGSVFLVKHPTEVKIDKNADLYTKNNVFGINNEGVLKILLIIPYYLYRSLLTVTKIKR